MLSLTEINEVLDYVENFDEKGIQFALLGTIGRGGSVLFHSLLDHHPQILAIPIHFYYYSEWETIFQYSAPETLVDDFFSKSLVLYKELTELGPERNITLNLQMDRIQELMKQILPYLSQISRKSFVLLFHFVYAKIFNIDLKQVKVLLLHNHAIPNLFGYLFHIMKIDQALTLEDVEPFWNLTPQQYAQSTDFFFENVLLDFPNAKLLATIRDPMAITYSTGGYFQGGNKLAPELGFYYWASYHMLMIYASLYGLKQKLGKRLQLIKFENVHCFPEKTMQETARFLEIEFQPSLLSSTFGGLLWSGSMATEKIIFGTDPKVVENDREKLKTWDPHTYTFYATLCTPLARIFGYNTYHMPAESLNWNEFIPQEFKTYWDYPFYLALNYQANLAELRKIYEMHPSSLSEYQAQIQRHFELHQRRIRFWEEYPLMRQKAIESLRKTGTELNQCEPLIV